MLRVVPDLYGQSEDEARASLTAGALSLGTRRSAFDRMTSSKSSPGRVSACGNAQSGTE